MNALVLSAVFGVLMMFSSFLLKRNAAIRNLAIVGLGLTLVGNIMDLKGIHLFSIHTEGMMSFSRFSLLFITIILVCMLLYFLLSARDMEKVGLNYAEYFALLFFISCGMILTVSFDSLLILFLGIEIISIPLYILTGSDKRNLKSNEASLKYFLMGAFSTGLMLMGIALVYGATGSFSGHIQFEDISSVSPLLVVGMMLLLFSMSFKVSAAPFHFWTPDVYDGAPTVFTAFMATLVKAAVFAGFLRLFDNAFGQLHDQWKLLIAILVVVTLFIGNLTAVFQQSVKRMLAYSSISQAGFMLLAVFAMNQDAKEGLLLYAAAYSLATIGIFAVLLKLRDYTFEGFNGFAKKEPLLAATTSIFIFSLAGIPLTAGFLSKFYMLKAAMEAGGYLWVVIFAVLMTAVSLYYYFRVIQAMYFKDGNAEVAQVSSGFKGLLVLVAALVILLGMYPGLIIRLLYF